MLKQVSSELEEKEIKLAVTDEAKDFIGKKGYDEVFGARPLRRVIQSMVEDRMSEDLLRARFSAGDTATVDIEDGDLVIRTGIEQDLKEKGIKLVITDSVKEYMGKDTRGFSKLRQAEELILNELQSGEVAVVELDEDEIVFSKHTEPVEALTGK